MPIFYNTSAPTSTSHNTINSTIINYGIRDFLLNHNLAPVYPFIPTNINGSPQVGQPVLDTMVGTGNITTPFGLPLDVNGVIRMQIAVLQNQYINTSSTATALTDINYLPPIGNPYPTSTAPFGQLYNNIDHDQFGLKGKMNEGNFRTTNTLTNLYLDSDSQIDMSDFLNLLPIQTNQQLTNYLDVFGGLNQGGTAGEQAVNILGSVLNGQGVGIGSNGLIPNFDVRASLAGRVLGATGFLKDTKLGTIGGQQLALALANNAAFNVQQDIIGSLNVSDNVLSLVKNGTLAGFRPSYKITIPASSTGRVIEEAGSILGFTLPKSYLGDQGSIFQSENGDAENIDRANEMIKNTGKGQALALVNNMMENIKVNQSKSVFRSGYAPAFTNNKGNYDENAIGSDANLYAYSDGQGHFVHLLSSNESGGIIPNISINREAKTVASGFDSMPQTSYEYHAFPTKQIWNTDVSDALNSEYTEGTTIPTNNPLTKKSLLVKTQKLFNSVGMRNLISSKGDMTIDFPTQIQTSVVGGGISKGNAVLKGDRFNPDGTYKGDSQKAQDTYCRSWTPQDRYDSVTKLVRSGVDGIASTIDGESEFSGDGINKKVPYRFQTENSVIGGYGFPKIAPYTTDIPTDPKKFMFSIENLAWCDDIPNLLAAEVGPGDLISGKKGRIMWFPPYNIQFNEVSAINLESNSFIGRGEPVYTYNNTERSGNISFQIVVDHPTYVNTFRGANGPDDHFINSFWAGCVDPNDLFSKKLLTVSETSKIETNIVTTPQKREITPEIPPEPISIYFPNDNIIRPVRYENGLDDNDNPINYEENPLGRPYGLGEFPGLYTLGGTENWPDRTNFSLNNTKITIGGIDYTGTNEDSQLWVGLSDYLDSQCPSCKIKVKGFASQQGRQGPNTKLSIDRATAVIDFLKTVLFTKLTPSERDKRFYKPESEIVTTSSCKPSSKSNKEPVDTIDCKKDRKAVISFIADTDLANEQLGELPKIITTEQKQIKSSITNRLYDETKYFDQLTDVDPFIFDKFREKIKYFHPAFHSTTPEGLNSRLTFLLQCTRQGRTLESQGANNLAFGRPPVCILRIGDFYNTKIMMDSLAIDYEPLVWDLNPEGVGVQPMIANVNISFKFIGGSTLMGPINKLQNALSFNYFANTQVYDPRADYLSSNRPIINKKNEKGETIKSEVPLAKNGYYINNLVDDTYNGNVNGLNKPVITEETINNDPDINQTISNNNLTNNVGSNDIG